MRDDRGSAFVAMVGYGDESARGAVSTGLQYLVE
jgi:hypothetical protein